MAEVSNEKIKEIAEQLEQSSMAMTLGKRVLDAQTLLIGAMEKRIKELEDADKRLRSALDNTASWLRHEAGQQLDDAGAYRGAVEEGLFSAYHKAADEIEKVLL